MIPVLLNSVVLKVFVQPFFRVVLAIDGIRVREIFVDGGRIIISKSLEDPFHHQFGNIRGSTVFALVEQNSPRNAAFQFWRSLKITKTLAYFSHNACQNSVAMFMLRVSARLVNNLLIISQGTAPATRMFTFCAL